MILITARVERPARQSSSADRAWSDGARLCSKPDARRNMKAMGARDVVIGEMDDPRAPLASHARPLRRSITSAECQPARIAFGKTMIDAAASAGVQRFVYHSVLHPQIEAMPHHWNKMRVEEMLFSSRLDVTSCSRRPTCRTAGRVGPHGGDGIYRVPYTVEDAAELVDLNDVAQAAATVLTDDGPHRRNL